ncbi:hypothetical protein CC80DRAFT_556388 [Byssothecium circinans]|uniref:Uncharacterized protein n=1 Tax=Byssothecium circinans TaxID=147558 RepID=A0A6A5T843_9PLEO|nr:hypothetical protein CC80DRAFT_556388 [Byssothecium circinans]
MPYLIRSHSSPYVFSTASRDISTFLHTTHRWTVMWFDPAKVADAVTTSCIVETADGGVELDEHILNPRGIEEGMRTMLDWDGFGDVDIKYAGRLRGRKGGGGTWAE